MNIFNFKWYVMIDFAAAFAASISNLMYYTLKPKCFRRIRDSNFKTYMTNILFLSLTLFFLPLQASPTFVEDKITLPILSPAFMDRKTAKMRLENGLEVYIVSDPELDKAVAALSVDVGSWYDPPKHQGMAHFLEHMLFLGTKKYPKESEFDHFLKAHDGKSNAMTAQTYTVYAFEVNKNAFPEALDRFASFFEEPLLSVSGVSREINAISNEFAGKMTNDSVRTQFVLKQLANQQHPYSQNNAGNRVTLANTSTEDLKNWYLQYYSANRMHLVIKAPIELEKLKEIVIATCSAIPLRTVTPSKFSDPMTDSHLDGYAVFIEPVEEVRTLTLFWEMPGHFAKELDTKPDQIVSYLLGYEGSKSLYAELLRENLATSVESGASHPSEEHTIFYIKIDLTKKGINNFHTIVTRVFQAIHNLKTRGVPRYIFDEVQKMATINFQYPSRQGSFEDVIHDAVTLIKEPLETFPLHTKVIQKYDPALIEEFLNHLTAKHVQIVVLAPTKETKVKPDKKEPWMDIPYAVRPIPSKVIDAWANVQDHPDIDLPPPNELIPQHLQLYHSLLGSKSRVKTKKLFETDKGTLYFAPDEQYGVPLISWTLSLLTPEVNKDNPVSIVQTDLMVLMLKETLNPWGYLAKIAGLEYDIRRQNNGITIAINGYNENALRLLEEIIVTLNTLDVTPETYERLKEKLQREYKNFTKKPPLQRGMEVLKKIFYENYITEAGKNEALREVTLESMTQFIKNFSQKIYLEAFFYGNMKEEQAKVVWHHLNEAYKGLPYPRKEHPATYVALLPEEGGPYILDTRIPSNGNGLILAVEQDHYSIREECIQEIAAQMLTSAYFTSLRTKQQTGYIVSLFPEELELQLVTIFVIESHTHDPQDLLSRTERVIESYLNRLATDPEEEKNFEAVRAAKIIAMETPPKNLEEMGKKLYSLAFRYDEDFYRSEQMAQGFRSLNYMDFVRDANKIFGRSNKKRLALYIHGKISDEAKFRYIRAQSASWLKENSKYRDRYEIK